MHLSRFRQVRVFVVAIVWICPMSNMASSLNKFRRIGYGWCKNNWQNRIQRSVSSPSVQMPNLFNLLGDLLRICISEDSSALFQGRDSYTSAVDVSIFWNPLIILLVPTPVGYLCGRCAANYMSTDRFEMPERPHIMTPPSPSLSILEPTIIWRKTTSKSIVRDFFTILYRNLSVHCRHWSRLQGEWGENEERNPIWFKFVHARAILISLVCLRITF
jgi:hypothetical protein